MGTSKRKVAKLTDTPAAHRASKREVELEIVSNSWLSLNESAGFDQMVESWARKVDLVSERTPEAPSGIFDQILVRQLEPIERLLNNSEVTTYTDPLTELAEASPTPVMALSPDGTVAAVSTSGESHFGVNLGAYGGDD